jgi:8-oxo-dGTP pyrophosphatase MutT (NUDIX family)
MKIIYCAGGIVWRDKYGSREVLLILSHNDKKWKFPKGHIDETDPGWDLAAQREVKEETGYDTVIIDFAGYTKYPVNGKPKVVFYWHMEARGESDFEPNDEIECFEWLTPSEAVDRLSFLNDKQFFLKFAVDTDRSNG